MYHINFSIVNRILGYENLVQKWAWVPPSSRQVYLEEGSKMKLWLPFAPEGCGEGAVSDLRGALEADTLESTIIMFHINDCSLVTCPLGVTNRGSAGWVTKWW